MYWKIQNDGVASIECLTLLGLSTARGDDEKIGQFGTGCKHAINILLRAGIDVVFYLGKDKLTFFAQPRTIAGSNKVYNQICYCHLSDGKEVVRETSMTLEFGEIDWTNIHMALREFVSNAIDGGNPSFSKVNQVVPEEGKTLVIISDTPEVSKYFLNIGQHFLHFGSRNQEGPIKKEDNGPPSLYRKGCFVRQLGSMNSLFDYNIKDLDIDECRNLDDWRATDAITKTVARSTFALKEIISSLVGGDSAFFEAQSLNTSITYLVNRPELKRIWESLCGEKAICESSILPLIHGKVDSSKYVVIQSGIWYQTLKRAGIKTVIELCLDKVSSKGHEIIGTLPETTKTLNRVWNILERRGLTMGKKKPMVKNFIFNGADKILGYCENETIFINEEVRSSVETVFEELVHYISGANDCTRQYQEYVNSVFARLIEKREKVK